MGTVLRPVKNWGFFQRKRDYPSTISAANVSRGYELFLPLNIKGSLLHLLSQPKNSSILLDCRQSGTQSCEEDALPFLRCWLMRAPSDWFLRVCLKRWKDLWHRFHLWCLISRHTPERNSPCLHLLRVVREVLRVLADPQVPEFHLFQLGLEVLSLPVVFIKTSHQFLSATEYLRSLIMFIMQSSYWSSFFSGRAWRSLRSRASWKTCRTSWASRTTLTRRTLEYHHKATGRSDKTSEEYKHEVTKAVNCTHSRSRWTMRTLISFQAMSSLQNRAEPKTSVMEETSNILFVLH